MVTGRERERSKGVCYEVEEVNGVTGRERGTWMLVEYYTGVSQDFLR